VGGGEKNVLSGYRVMPHAHISLITLGVSDVPRAAHFYEALGFKRKMKAAPESEVAFFDAGTLALSLYAVSGLARDAGFAGETTPSAFRGMSLAWNCISEAEVDAVMALALQAGATELTPAKRADWGGYHAHFSDPDGHIWEVAHNPQFPLSADGQPTLPD
jgi:catechol 2,3-dioxygenase-like lactoylglutathione lyase family enzyme